MTESDRKKALASHFDQLAHPNQFFASGWITTRAKINEHKIVSNLLGSEGNNQDKKALDIGCGIGGYFDIMLEKGFAVVGFDIAQNMVKVCHSKFAQRDSLQLMVANHENIPFQPNSFDLVLCIDTLQYMSEVSRKSALKNMAKLAKPGGLIIVDIKNKSCPAFRLVRYHKRGKGIYSIASVTSVLKESGCKIEVIKGVFWPTFISLFVVVKARRIAKG